MRTLSTAIVGAMLLSTANAITYPKFMQCDPRWAHVKDVQQSTLCSDNGLVTAAAMMVSGLKGTLHGSEVTPKSLNEWLNGVSALQSHKHCSSSYCEELLLTAPEALVPGLGFVEEMDTPAGEAIQTQILAENLAYLAKVRNGTHYVLLTSYDASINAFRVNDPLYDVTSYSYDEVSAVVVYALPRWESELHAIIPHRYPLYKQCNSTWGSHMISTKTICQVGCLMSSVSMALAGKHLTINHKHSDPNTLNAWLRANHGYQGNLLINSRVAAINPSHISWPSDAYHPKNDISLSKVLQELKDGRPMIANVNHGGHFVLVVGYDANNHDTLYINDPGYTRNTYSYRNDVVGWRLFQMKQA